MDELWRIHAGSEAESGCWGVNRPLGRKPAAGA